LAFDVEQHDEILNRTLREVQTGAFDNVKSLESEIADLVALGVASNMIRSQIMGVFEKHSASVADVATPLVDISTNWMAQSKFPVDSKDLVAQDTLINQSKATLSSTMLAHAEDVISTVVLGTVASLGTVAMTNQVRGRISGIWMDSDDPEIRREQRKLRGLMRERDLASAYKDTSIAMATPLAALAATVAVIKSKLPGDVNTAASLAVKMETAGEQIVGQFDGTFAAARAERLGTERFRYAGGIIETTRPFCQDMLGREFDRDEIENIWNSQSWAGKQPGDPYIVRGGYNCMHYWVPIESEED